MLQAVRTVPSLVESIWQADFWGSLFTYWVVLCHQARHICGWLRMKVFLGLCFSSGPTVRGSDRRHPPTAGIALWYNFPAPYTTGCTGVCPVPKWWQYFSWRIRVYSIRIAATLLWVSWQPFHGRCCLHMQ